MSGIRPVRSVRPSSVRQLHSLPTAARPSRVRCSRRDSVPRVRRSRVRCSRVGSAPRVRRSRIRCSRKDSAPRARLSRVRCSRRDNGLLIRRVRMPSSARLHIRTSCSRRDSSVLSVPVPRSRIPQPRPEQSRDLHAEQPQRPVRPRPEGQQTHAVRPRPVSRPAPEAVVQAEPIERPVRPAEPEVPRRAGRSGCLGGLIYFAFVVSISIILACVGWMAASDVLALNKEPVTATVTLDKAEFKDVTISYTDAEGNAKERSGHQVSVGYVAKQLKDAGIIKYKGLFQLYCSVSHAKTKIDPGTYELSTNYDYRALVKKMQVGSGAMVTTKVTIPEGYTMEQIFHKLEDENVCSYDDLMDAAANYSYNYSFIDQSMQGDAKRLEGFLFPDTYEFYQGMQASSAINKFLENFHDRLTAEMLEKADERGMTMQEVVTVASMIEKEAANDDERAMIAAVIYNRIEAGMPLQIDSTIMYVLPEHKDVLTVEDTKIDSPYNTYQNKGLPPTPIANPGLASIKATLSPASTQALYYALDAESGTHKFFTNYGEFQAFVAKQSYSQ